ncbi:MAG: NAD-dependent epimerase/dehydratase family protein [Acidimicrobiales bacterium]
MRLFVTGAGGFIGRAVVREALADGHEVVALVRRPGDAARFEPAPAANGSTPAPPSHRRRLRVVAGDVRHPAPWRQDLAGCDAVIHLAASFADLADQFAVTVVGTERLLDAMDASGVHRLTLVSTFSVYDYADLDSRSTLDETSPVAADPARYDDYTVTKIEQERLAREWAATTDGAELTVLRPGAVYGPGRWWDGGRILSVGPVAVSAGPRVRMKLIHVDDCARAMVAAAVVPDAVGETLNIVGDDPPTQRRFERALRDGGIVDGRSLPIPYAAVKAFSVAVDAVDRHLLGSRARVPWFGSPARVDAMLRPLRYSNDRAKRVLGWAPQVTLAQAVAP